MKNLISSNFVRGAALTLSTRVAMALNSVVTGIVIARWLGAGDLGVFLVLSTAIQLAVLVSGFGLHMTSNQFTAGRPERLKPVGLNILMILAPGSLLVAGLVWSFSPFVLAGVPAELIVIAIISIPFQSLTGSLLGLFFAQGEVRYFNVLDLASQVLIFVSSVIVLVVFKRGLYVLVLTNSIVYLLFSAAVTSLFFSYANRQAGSIPWRPDLSMIGEMVTYSAKGFVLWISTFLLYRMDLFVVNAYRGKTEAAVYAVATQCTLFLLLLPHVIAYMLQTKASADPDQAGMLTAKTVRYTAGLLGAACLATIPGAYLVVFAYGPDFVSLPLYLWILLPGVWFVGTQYVLLQYFVAKGIPVLIPVAWVLVLVLNLISNLVLVPMYGPVGAAIASSISYIAISAAILQYFRATTGIGMKELFLGAPVTR